LPVYVRWGARVPVYPEPVQCTDEMDMDQAIDLVFDQGYRGFVDSVLGAVTGW